MESFRIASGPASLACVRSGRGSPLLLAHPIVFSKAFWALDVFAEQFDVAALDQRGHGDSTGPVDLDGMAEDLGAVMDHLGWREAAVGGTSLGAATTLRFALGHPELVTLLVQDLPGFGPASRRDPARTARLSEAFETGDLDLGARRITEGMGAPRARAWQEALAADWRHYDPALLGPKLAQALRSTLAWRVVDRWPEDLARLSMPVRILAVQGDPTHPYETAQAMAGAIPNATLVARVPSLSPEAIARQWIEVIRAR